MPHRELKKAHKLELEKLENSYKEALKVEKASAQEKLGTVRPWEEAWERRLVPAPWPGVSTALKFPFQSPGG